MTSQLLNETILKHLEDIQQATLGVSGMSAVLQEISINKDEMDSPLFKQSLDGSVANQLQAGIKCLSDLSTEKLDMLQDLVRREARRRVSIVDTDRAKAA